MPKGEIEGIRIVGSPSIPTKHLKSCLYCQETSLKSMNISHGLRYLMHLHFICFTQRIAASLAILFSEEVLYYILVSSLVFQTSHFWQLRLCICLGAQTSLGLRSSLCQPVTKWFVSKGSNLVLMIHRPMYSMTSRCCLSHGPLVDWVRGSITLLLLFESKLLLERVFCFIELVVVHSPLVMSFSVWQLFTCVQNPFWDNLLDELTSSP